ncbi:MAG: nitroreductase/quinone reductase family protein [Anaerolineae bacterium]
MSSIHLPRLPRRAVRLRKVQQYEPRIAYALGLGPLVGRLVLLLTTTGRTTGKRHVTPLQYEASGGHYYVASARGVKADWYRNVLAAPHVSVRVKRRRFDGIAEATTDVKRITDFLELRLKRHPRMMRAILQAQGLPAQPSRQQLEDYAARLSLVVIRPQGEAPPSEEP